MYIPAILYIPVIYAIDLVDNRDMYIYIKVHTFYHWLRYLPQIPVGTNNIILLFISIDIWWTANTYKTNANIHRIVILSKT